MNKMPGKLGAVQAKKSYKSVLKLEVFFTGGRVAVSPDGTRFACPCGEEVKLVGFETGVVQKTFGGDSELVTAVSLSPDGVSLFSSSRSLQTKWWDITTGECKRSWKAHDGPVADMAVDASGGLLATGSADRGVRVWDVAGGFCTHSFRGHEGVVLCVQFHPDPHRLLLFSSSEDSQVRVWDLVGRTCIATLDKHFSAVTSLAFSPSGWSLLSAGRDKVVHIWDLRDYKLQSTVAVYEALEGIVVLPAATLVAASVRAPGSKATKKLPALGKGPEVVAFVTVGEAGSLRAWRSDSGACVTEEQILRRSRRGGKDGQEGDGHTFTGICLVPGSSTLMCVTSDQRLMLFSGAEANSKAFFLKESKPELPLVRQMIGNNGEVTDLRFVGHEEKLLAVATNSEQVILHEVGSMSCVKVLQGHTDTVLCLDTCQPPTGPPLLASAGKDNCVRVWDAQAGKCQALGTGHTAAVSAVAFFRKTPSFLLTGSSDRTLKVWALEGLEDGVEEKKLRSVAVVAAHDKDINTVAVAPNDSLACSGSQDRTARLWKLPELTPVLTLRGHKRGIWSVEFSPVDQCVVTASGDQTIRIWALGDGSCLKSLQGHTGSVLRVSFLTRGTQLISSGADGLVKLWSIRIGECSATFDHHEDKVWALDVSRPTEMLATGGADSLVNVWRDCTVEEDEEAAKKEDEEILRSQELDNAVACANYVQALQLAFELRRPYKMLSVFSELLKETEAEGKLQQVVGDVEGEQLQVLLEYVREWNTNARFCHVAQRVLSAVLTLHSPNQLAEVPDIRNILDGLLPYTQRHMVRIDRLARSTFLLDFCLAAMDVLSPLEEEESLLDRLKRQKGIRASSIPAAEFPGKGEKRRRKLERLLIGGAIALPEAACVTNGTSAAKAAADMVLPPQEGAEALADEGKNNNWDPLGAKPMDTLARDTEPRGVRGASEAPAENNGEGKGNPSTGKKKRKKKRMSVGDASKVAQAMVVS